MMTSLERFHEHIASLQDRQEKLEAEQKELLRQHNYFKGAYSRAEITEDEIELEKAKWGLSIIDEKLADLDKQFQNLNTLPVAQDALEELISQRRNLEGEMDEQRDVVSRSIQQLLSELGKLEDIQRESVNLSYYSQPICATLRQNPLPEIGIGGKFKLESLLEDITNAVRRLRGK
jgi:chromosome segregation ATPase